MRISLIQPKHLRGPERIFEPLGLGYIASFLRKKGYKDISIHSATFESDKKIVKDATLADIVGMTTMSPMMTHANILASEIKKRNSKASIVLGGFHPSALPEATLRNRNIDFVVRGEGEITFYELAETIKGNKRIEDVAGISYRQDGRIIHNQPRELIKGIDDIPSPARDLLGQNNFTRRYYQYLGEKRATVLSSRGCSYDCLCCSSQCVWTRKWRGRSAGNIISEIKELVENYNVNYIDFLDGIFTMNKQRVLDFCAGLSDEKITIGWGCYVHPSTVDRNTLEVMKEAGCQEIYLGIESGSPLILEELHKGSTIEQIKNVLSIAKDISLPVLALFMLGLPGDNYSTIKASEDLIDETEPDYVAFSILTPMPGCNYYKIARRSGYVSDNLDWSKIDWGKATMPTRHLSIKDINIEYKRLKRKFAYLSKIRCFSITYLLSKAWVELKNTPVSEFNFLLFKLWRYLRLTIFKNIFSDESGR